MRVLPQENPQHFAIEALPLRGRVLYGPVVVLLVAAIILGWGPFNQSDAFARALACTGLGIMAAVYAFGRFGTIIDREAKTLCNWYNCFGLGIRWTFPMNPAAVRLECRMGGHRDVSELQYTRHLFLLNRFGPPLRIGRVKHVGESRQLARAIANFLHVPVEEGTCKPSDQVCVPLPWAALGHGFFRGAGFFLGRPASLASTSN